jgi:Flp pilus assembly protein TadG
MRRFVEGLRDDRRGVSAIEFAIVAPVLILMVIGILQLGMFFYGHAALRNAVSEGARFATIFPRPTEAQVIARIQSYRSTAAHGTYSTPTVAYQRNAATGLWRANISMTYTARFNLILFKYTKSVTYARQANVQPPPP